LKGFVYDIAGGARSGLDNFHRTTKEIAEYMSRQHKEAGDFIDALEDPNKLTFNDIPAPTRPADPNDFFLWLSNGSFLLLSLILPR
jgi:hypothetical protein